MLAAASCGSTATRCGARKTLRLVRAIRRVWAPILRAGIGERSQCISRKHDGRRQVCIIVGDGVWKIENASLQTASSLTPYSIPNVGVPPMWEARSVAAILVPGWRLPSSIAATERASHIQGLKPESEVAEFLQPTAYSLTAYSL